MDIWVLTTLSPGLNSALLRLGPDKYNKYYCAPVSKVQIFNLNAVVIRFETLSEVNTFKPRIRSAGL